MKDQSKTKQLLIQELSSLRQRITELEQSESERKRVEEALRESEKRYRELNDFLPISIFEVDAAGSVVSFNRTALKVFGYNEEDYKEGMNALQFFVPEEWQRVGEKMGKVIQGTSTPGQEFTFIRKDGSTFIGLIYSAPNIQQNKAVGIKGAIIDITERKATEEALQASSELFSLFIRHSPIYTYIKEVTPTQSLVLQASDNFGQMIGIPGSEMAGKTMTELFPPELAAKITGDDWAVVSGGDVLRLDEELNGRSYTTIKFPIIRGDKALLAGYTIDITERKQAEEALREEHQRLTGIVKGTNVGTWEWNVQTGETIFNDRWAEIIGYTLDEISPVSIETWMKFAHEADLKASGALLEKHFRGEIDYYEFESRMKHKDGNLVWVLDRGKVISWTEDGKPLMMMGTHQDITAQKLSEGALRESDERFRKLADSTWEGIVIHKEGIVLDVNESILKMFGWRAEDAIGKSALMFLAPESIEPALQKLSESIDAPQIYFEGKGLRKDKTVFHIEVLGRPIRYKNLDARVIAIRDITERKRAEEEKRNLEERLNRAEKMESIGTLAGGVAHDLNNMLGALIGHAELLKGDLKKTDPMYKSIESIMTSGQKAAKVVQDLLTMARRGVVLKEPASLNKIAADQLKSSEIRNLLSSHSFVTIKTKYDRDLLDINASSIHIERALTNLISNALRAMRGDGTLTIRTENRYLEGPLMAYETVPKGEYAVLSVSDTGIGIFPEYMNNLFEPFYLRKVLKKGGSGLGLSVIWGAMKDHDGYIDVTSELGQGTTFSLYFPVTRDDTVRWVEHSVDEYRGYGETILVVDDEDLQCSVAEKMLTRLNYVVKSVESGEEALEYLADHDVDLIVLDMIMEPGMDGYDTYRRILGIKKRQKAIIFSGFTKTERVKMAQDLGAGEFIMKPYLMERLGIAVRKELDRKG